MSIFIVLQRYVGYDMIDGVSFRYVDLDSCMYGYMVVSLFYYFCAALLTSE